MPVEKTCIGQGAEALDELSGGGIDLSRVMEWVLAKVRYCPGNELSLGAKKVPARGSLYESYMEYVDSYGIEPLAYTSFGDALDDFARVQGCGNEKEGAWQSNGGAKPRGGGFAKEEHDVRFSQIYYDGDRALARIRKREGGVGKRGGV